MRSLGTREIHQKAKDFGLSTSGEKKEIIKRILRRHEDIQNAVDSQLAARQAEMEEAAQRAADEREFPATIPMDEDSPSALQRFPGSFSETVTFGGEASFPQALQSRTV